MLNFYLPVFLCAKHTPLHKAAEHTVYSYVSFFCLFSISVSFVIVNNYPL